MGRQLRFNYSFSTGYVIPYPLQGPNTLIYPIFQGLMADIAPTQTEILNFTISSKNILPYDITFPTSGGNYLAIGIPAQFGMIDTFVFNGFPVRFPLVPSNDQDALATNGTNVGQPYFLYINGVQYAYNFYRSEFPQHGTNILITVPAS